MTTVSRYVMTLLLVYVCVCALPLTCSGAAAYNRVAVMPFDNVENDQALEPWRSGFAWRVACDLVQTEVPKVQQSSYSSVAGSLTNSGWKGERITLELATKVARDLGCDTLALGEFSRVEGLWKVKIRILHLGNAEPERAIQLEEPSTDEVLLRIKEAVCAALRLSPLPAGLRLAREYPCSDATWEKLVRLEQLKDQAQTEKTVNALREILAAEPMAYSARSLLVLCLLESQDFKQAAAESRKLVEQAPGLCDGYGLLAASLRTDGQAKDREEALLSALKVHPGCPFATSALLSEWQSQERWTDIRKLCEAPEQTPVGTKTRTAYLALARAMLQDREGAGKLLEELNVTDEEDVNLHGIVALAAAPASPKLLAREVLWFQRRSATNSAAREALSDIDGSFKLLIDESPAPFAMPRSFTQEELQAELERRLTPEEMPLAMSPIAVTPEVQRMARDLTAGLTNQATKFAVLFGFVHEQRLKADTTWEQEEASDAPRMVCHHYASQLVALARAVAIRAWLVHVDIMSDEVSTYHDRVGVMLDGHFLQSDPTWGALMMNWHVVTEQARVLNDLEAIAHHLCQTNSLATTRVSLKLDPEDLWTRIVCVTRLADLNEVTEAEELWSRLPPESTNLWGYYLARGTLDFRKGDYAAALASLEKANKMGPNNIGVNYLLGLVYDELNERYKAVECLEKALKLGVTERMPAQMQDHVRLVLTGSLGPDISEQELRLRARKGDTVARVALINLLLDRGRDTADEAMRLLRELAEEGDPEGQAEYGRLLLLLSSGEAAEEALGFYRRAAIQGHVVAQSVLGKILYEGKLTAKNEVEASQWVHLAERAGDRDAKGLLWEMQLFLDAAAFAEGSERADEFKPVPEVSRKSETQAAGAPAR